MDKRIPVSVYEAAAGQWPGKCAVEAPDGILTYAELERGANAIAGNLLAEGFGSGKITAVFIPNSASYITSVLGVQKAGGTFMPADPNAPYERQVRMFTTADPSVVIVDEESIPAYRTFAERSGLKPMMLMVVETRGPVRLYPSGGTCSVEPVTDHEPPELLPDPDDDLYVIFTSGTTGNPKAVLGQQKGLAHFLNWERTEFGLDETVRASNLAPTTFDVSLRDIFVPLTVGGTVCVPEERVKSSPGELLDWLVSREINLVHIVPSVFRLLLDELEKRTDPHSVLYRMRYIMLAGEAVYGKDVLRFRDIAGDSVQLINLYGPSETTLAKLFCRLDFLPENPGRIMPLGRPISNTAVIILKNTTLCEIGEIGEICIKTPFRSKGYLNEPELTSQAFVANPLTDDLNDIIYRTGDMGRYLPDRSVEFAGRLDRQVKVNGVRVELSEVDEAVSSCPGIKQALVMPHNRENGETSLICYYTEENPVDVEELRESVSTSLYNAMIPGFFVRLDSFPLGINGKINRRALPKPDEIIYESTDYVPSETDTEKRLSVIWAEILGIGKIGVTTSFSALGGGSMQAIRCLGSISRSFETEISLHDFFEAATVRKLAVVIESTLDRTKGAAIPPQPVRPDYPSTHSQKRLWTLQKMIPNFTAFNIAGCFRVDGGMEENAFERALMNVVSRHEILRTVFFERGGELRQKVIPEPGIHLERLGHADSAQVVNRLVDGFCQTVFDLESGPLIRAGVFSDKSGKLLVFAIHHIVCDAWSLDIIQKETLTAYSEIIEDKPSSLPQPKLQYRDVTVWQNSRLASGELEVQRRFWLERLNGELPRLELPLDAPRPARRDYRGATYSYDISENLLDTIREYTSKNRRTVFAVLLAGLRALLFRYTGQSESIMNSPVTLRGRPELEKLPGDFTNTILLYGRVNDTMPFSTLVDDAADDIDHAMENREYPFDLLVPELDVKHDLSRAPVSDIGITLVEDYGDGVPPASGLRFEPYDVEASISKYDMVFHFSLSSGSLSLTIEYDAVILRESKIKRMAANLSTLLEHALSQPGTAVSGLSIIHPSERALLDSYQRPRPRNYPDSTIHGEFERVVSEQPDAVALALTNGSTVTFAELDTKANRIAAMLSDNGYGRGDRIAIYLRRGSDVPAVILGILKAGCIYVPIADDSPSPRIRYMLKDCQAAAVIVADDHRGILPDVLPRLNVDESHRYPGTPELVSVHPGDGAYIIYTSGSTGNPKGVLLPHLGLVNRTRDLGERASISSKDRFSQFASLSFDASLYEIFCSLLNGASLVVADRDTIEDTGAFIGLIESREVTFTLLPPTYLRRLGREKLPGIRILFTAGEAADVGDALFYARDIMYLNGYGPTEDSVCSAVFTVDPNRDYPLGLPIGDPVGDTEALVLDRNLRSVPVGVPGQLCVSDKGLALSYLNLPEQTAAVFIPHPFDPGRRLYLTGDLASWDEDGNLLFFGRTDDQVKISGHRIEPGEIESVLRGTEGIADACVVTAGDSGDKRLAAYYTGSADESELRNSLLKTLPRYMAPHFIMHLDVMPLTASGKIDRKALPDPLEKTDSEVRDAVSDEEVIITDIMGEVLDNQALSVTANFFAAGGDSIRAMQVVSRLREHGWSLSAADFFVTPVISDLARSLRRTLPAVTQEPVSGIVKNTPILIWFTQSVTARPEHFNQAVMLKSSDDVDFPSLQTALSSVWRHHDALRLVYTNGFFTILPDETPLNCEIMDIREESNPERAMLEAAERVQTGFDLAHGPLFRAVLIKCPDGDRLLLVSHHLVVDVVSWGILARDMEKAYIMARNGKPVSLPSKTHSYRDWADALHHKVESGGFDDEIHYWKKLSDAECDTVGIHNRDGSMVTKTAQIVGREVTGLLGDGASQEPLVRMLAGLGCALDQWKGMKRVRILLEGHGRSLADTRIDVSRTVGWFTAAWPFVLDCMPDIESAFSAVLATLSDVPNSGIGYGALRYLGGHDELEALTEISFNYLGRMELADGTFSLTNEPVGETVNPENHQGNILEFVLSVTDDTLDISLTFDSGCVSETEADYLLELYRERLKSITGCHAASFDYNEFGEGGLDGFLQNI